MRAIYLILGWGFVALGAIGAFLPVLPTTPFLLLAVACFARSSPRLERRLLDDPRFGPALRQWRERGAISPKAKGAALIGTSLGFVLFLLGGPHDALLIVGVAALMLGGIAYVFSRPSA